MPIAATLTTILVEAAKLMASSAAGEFAKGAGKAAFAALKARLTNEHDAKTLNLLEDAATNDAFKPAIEADLSKPAIAADDTLMALAKDLQQALADMPQSPAYAIDTKAIEAGGNMLLEQIEGIKAGRISAEGDMTIRGVSAPKP